MTARKFNSKVHEQRIVSAEFRADPDVEGRLTARVLTYGTVDSYSTTFSKGVFNASMQNRMPRIVWSHDWADVIGVWQTFTEDDGGLTLVGQLDMAMIGDTQIPAVPRAHQAWAQLQSGSIDQFSVGFWPEEAREVIIDGKTILEYTKGTLDEASLVMVGAVPGTKLLSLRSKLRDVLSRAGVDGAVIDEAEAAVEEVEASEESDEFPDWTVEDVGAWAVLADAGDEDAIEALSSIAEHEGLDHYEYETWVGFVNAELIEADETPRVEDDESDEDPPQAPSTAGDTEVSGEVDTAAAGGDTDDGTLVDEGDLDELDAEMEEALAKLDDLPSF